MSNQQSSSDAELKAALLAFWAAIGLSEKAGFNPQILFDLTKQARKDGGLKPFEQAPEGP